MNTSNKSGGGDIEFSFWGSPNTISYEKNDHVQLVESNETILNSEAESEHDYCSRSKAIAEGRNELMEMIQDIPESSYELSFQDMVLQQQHVPQTSSNETLMQSNSSEPQQQPQNKKLKKKNKKKNKSNRHGQILRVESMDSETFLLKMFFPTSFDWMKKGKVQNDSKVSSKPSFQGSTKQVDNKEWRIKRFFTEVGGRQNSGSSSSSNDKSRYVDRSFSFSRGCWPFF